jgi:transcriptional regulator with XRE-family HTH domain
MTVGERIQDLRKKKGYTQEKLAAHLILSRQAVAKWEQNACEPNLDCLVAMAELFEVDLDYLIAGKASDNATEKSP